MLFQKQAAVPDPKVTMEICVPRRGWDEKLKMESEVILSSTCLKASQLFQQI